MDEASLESFSPDTAQLSLLVIYIFTIAAERAYYAFAKRSDYDDRNMWGSVGVIALSTVLRAAMTLGVPFSLYLLLWEYRIAEIPVVWWSWLVVFLATDLIWYVDHRIAHRVGFFWAMHHVHHSTERLNIAAAGRAFVTDGILRAAYAGTLALIGFNFAQVVIVVIIADFLGIFSHTEAVGKLGWLDRFFATPANHRVHHGSNDRYIDKNYGHVLMLWDRLFGTYEPETEKVRFGVKQPVGTNNPLRVYGAGFGWLRDKMRRAASVRGAICCIFMPPEWEPAAKPPSRNAFKTAG